MRLQLGLGLGADYRADIRLQSARVADSQLVHCAAQQLLNTRCDVFLHKQYA